MVPFGCGFALHDLRQDLVVIIDDVIVAAFFVDLHETVELNDLTGGAQFNLPIGAGDIDCGAFQTRRFHLAGERALPDQVVKLALVGVLQCQAFGIGRHFGGADTFVRFLRVLGLVFIDARAAGHIAVAVTAFDRVTCGRHGFGGHVDTIGPHIGDVACFVQTLGALHGLARAKAVFAAGFLLQRRGHEGWRWVAGGRFRLDRFDGQVARCDRLHGQFGGGFIGDIELIELVAAKDGQPRFKAFAARSGQDGFDGPVFLGLENLDLHLALDDDAQAYRLHATCGTGTGQFAPKNGREIETHQIVQGAAGKIGFDQILIDLPRVLHRLGDGGFGDGVEDHAADRRVGFDGFAVPQGFLKMPADCLAFAVGVGCEDQCRVIFQRIGNRFDVLFRIGGDLPGHLEVRRQDRPSRSSAGRSRTCP